MCWDAVAWCEVGLHHAVLSFETKTLAYISDFYMNTRGLRFEVALPLGLQSSDGVFRKLWFLAAAVEGRWCMLRRLTPADLKAINGEAGDVVADAARLQHLLAAAFAVCTVHNLASLLRLVFADSTTFVIIREDDSFMH